MQLDAFGARIVVSGQRGPPLTGEIYWVGFQFHGAKSVDFVIRQPVEEIGDIGLRIRLSSDSYSKILRNHNNL